MSEPAAPLSGGRRRLSPDSKTGGACEDEHPATASGGSYAGREMNRNRAATAVTSLRQLRFRTIAARRSGSGGTEDSNPGQTKAVDSSGSRQRPDGIARESLGRQPWALRRGRVCHPVFRLPYERRLKRSATGSQRVVGSADRADLLFLQFRSAGGPSGPETRSVPKPSGRAGARMK